MVQDGQVQQKKQKSQTQAYYYQQEQVMIFVNKEFMIQQEMYVNGHLKKLLSQTILALSEGAFSARIALSFQQPTVATAVRPVATTASASGFHFFSRRPEPCTAIKQNELKQRIKYKNQNERKKSCTTQVNNRKRGKKKEDFDGSKFSLFYFKIKSKIIDKNIYKNYNTKW